MSKFGKLAALVIAFLVAFGGKDSRAEKEAKKGPRRPEKKVNHKEEAQAKKLSQQQK